MVTSEAKRETAGYLVKNYAVSTSQACRVLSMSVSTLRYQSKMAKKDEPVKALIKQVLGTKKLGRKKVIPKVQKLDPSLSSSVIRRVYEQQGFSLYKRMKSRKMKVVANPIEVPLAANVEWAIDFMSDTLMNRRRFRTLNVVDHFNRQCMGIYSSYSFPAYKVTETMDMIISMYGKPQKIRTDNGPEFISKTFQNWMHKNQIVWERIRPGNPQENAIVERFNRTYREDILDANQFISLAHHQTLTDDWVQDYNTNRPHESLGNKSPLEYVA